VRLGHWQKVSILQRASQIDLLFFCATVESFHLAASELEKPCTANMASLTQRHSLGGAAGTKQAFVKAVPVSCGRPAVSLRSKSVQCAAAAVETKVCFNCSCAAQQQLQHHHRW
jgi:hypothetical protein